jgi:hypothetical protein
MARNDLELGAEWVAQTTEGLSATVEKKIMISEAYARLLAEERDSRVGLDASGHQALAEYREALRRAAVSS